MFDIDPPSRSSKIGEVESNNLSKTSFKKDETASHRASKIMKNQLTQYNAITKKCRSGNSTSSKYKKHHSITKSFHEDASEDFSNIEEKISFHNLH